MLSGLVTSSAGTALWNTLLEEGWNKGEEEDESVSSYGVK
jgi:hypothetical protein